MRTTALAVFGAFLLATFAVGGAEKPAPDAPKAAPKAAADAAIQKLIDDLGSDDWRTREKAGADLAAKGEKALPLMRAALLATDSPEVQRRLAVLVRKFDRERLVEPKRVTFSAKDRTPKQLLEEIAKQTGYRIEYGGGPESKHSFEFDKVPFWQAVDAVADAAGLNVYADYDDELIRVYNQNTVSPYVAYAGPFRFLANSINSSRNVQLSGISRRGNNGRISEYINLNFYIQSEPKNPMLGVMQPELTEAKDDLGGSLLPPKDGNNVRSSSYYSGSFRGHNAHMGVNLTRADRAATAIKSLKGRVVIVLLSGTAPDIVIGDILKVKKKEFTGRTVAVEIEAVDEDATQKGNYTVSLVAKRVTPVDPNRGEDYAWSDNLWHRMELSDEKGNKYHCHGPSQHDNNGGSVRMTVQFGTESRRGGQPAAVKPGAPVRLTFNELLTLNHEVGFEFKDIPLP